VTFGWPDVVTGVLPLVVVDGARLTVTEAGRPLVRSMAAVFDAYLDPHAGRHSRSL